MSVRKRSWTTSKGEPREAWIVDYVVKGSRHIETFKRKGRRRVSCERNSRCRQRHSHPREPQSDRCTGCRAVANHRRAWRLERSTVEHYRTHVARHIVPRIGATRLATLTTPMVSSFRDALLRDLSRATARKVLVSFRSIIKDARRRGTIAHNVAEGVTIGSDKRAARLPEVGRDIPTPDEVRRLLAASPARWRPFLTAAAFTGLRASELRGLRWCDIDLAAGIIHVRQRADEWGSIGPPKTRTSERSVPIGPFVVNTLRTWKLAGPNEALAFPGKDGEPLTHSVVLNSGYWPAQRTAGLVNNEGEPKYPGIHALRHFFASLCINRRRDGGLELPIKTVQQRLGHSTIVMTADTYGHLFPRGDDSEELAAAERILLSPITN